jgi:hypothetical protein
MFDVAERLSGIGHRKMCEPDRRERIANIPPVTGAAAAFIQALIS